MPSATIKLFLPLDAKSLRTAEIVNWSIIAIAAPRTELDELLGRDELKKAGVYILVGSDPHSNVQTAYIGEAEVIAERLRQHKDKEWNSAIVFTSKDENLTKAHVKYLESHLIDEANQVKRFKLDQNKTSGAKLPESDAADMEEFLGKIRQLLPVLGSDILIPVGKIISQSHASGSELILYCTNKGVDAKGQRTPNGFVVFKDSTAVLQETPSYKSYPYLLAMRQQLLADGSLEKDGDFLRFTRDVEFSSPSSAGSVVSGSNVNGLIVWLTKDGRQLKSLN